MKCAGLLMSFAMLSTLAAFAADAQTTPAQDQAPEPQPTAINEKPPLPPWRAALYLGATFSGQSSYSVTLANGGGTLPTTSTNDPASYCFGVEVGHQFGIFNIGMSFDYANYPKSDPKDNTDINLTLMIVPKITWQRDSFTLWAGLAGGITQVALGTPPTATGTLNTGSSTTTVTTITNSKLGGLTSIPVSFTWSPRVGIDVPFSEKYFWGGQVAYFSTAITASDASIFNSPTVSFTRSWFEASALIGLRY